MLYFQQEGVAEVELEANIPLTVVKVLYGGSGEFLKGKSVAPREGSKPAARKQAAGWLNQFPDP